MSETDPVRSAGPSPPSLIELFRGFFFLGVTGFGGVLPLAHDGIVVRRRWLAEEEFVDLLGLCQLLPGGNILNLSIAIGMRFHGVIGALTAFCGLLAAPSVIVILLGSLYAQVRGDPAVAHLLAGLAAAAAGLLASMTFRLALRLRSVPTAMIVAAATFLAIAVLRLPLVPTMLVLLPISAIAAHRRIP